MSDSRLTVPMDIDPVDDGPKSMPPAPSSPLNQKELAILKEEDARQAIDMLRGDDVEGRVSAANKLEAIAVALGQERTREELLPFLADGIDDEDEVLVSIASSLGKMVEHVGGSDHAEKLLMPLELLLTVEENTVRDAACASTKVVAESLPSPAFESRYASLLEDLANKEWFTARISAATLLPSAYARLTNHQQSSILKNFESLCRDETPMVRRVAAQQLGNILKAVLKAKGRMCFTADGDVSKIIIPLYEFLATTEQPDSVRLQTTQNCVSFGQVLSEVGPNWTESELKLVDRLMPLIVATIDDRSWRVRWTAASKFADVIEAFGPLPKAEELIPAYEKLLQDPEAEVRTAATFNLAAVAKCRAMVPPPAGREGSSPPSERITVAERLVKRVTSLTEDDSEHVRAALAMVATDLAPILGKDATISHLVPPVLLLLRDAASEVRLNLISSLSSLNEVIGVDLLSQSLLPAILDLAQDAKWRIRSAIIKQIPLLAEQLGINFFSDKLASLCVAWLGDDIASIRNAAAHNLQDLTALFGTAWAIEYIFPSIEEIRHHVSYLRRLTAVKACALMSSKMESDVVKLEILPLVLEMANDDVANIRFNVAEALRDIARICGKSLYESQVRPVINLLSEDYDRDVRFFAERASKSLEKEFNEGVVGMQE
mmetsp:Transcript_12682/g.19642  ORF Transcript_12682/g.19642 Transcript_12682/m.19642 type:complete len:662 (-) Transcript_12682:352-2337(-)